LFGRSHGPPLLLDNCRFGRHPGGANLSLLLRNRLVPSLVGLSGPLCLFARLFLNPALCLVPLALELTPALIGLVFDRGTALAGISAAFLELIIGTAPFPIGISLELARPAKFVELCPLQSALLRQSAVPPPTPSDLFRRSLEAFEGQRRRPSVGIVAALPGDQFHCRQG
jgi:hypothetical protein